MMTILTMTTTTTMTIMTIMTMTMMMMIHTRAPLLLHQLVCRVAASAELFLPPMYRPPDTGYKYKCSKIQIQQRTNIHTNANTTKELNNQHVKQQHLLIIQSFLLQSHREK